MCSIAAALLTAPALASSQYRGHFVPGMAGMSAGRQADPGNTIGLSYLTHGADAFRDASGDTSSIRDVALHRVELALTHVTRRTLAGATYGAALRACFLQGLNPGVSVRGLSEPLGFGSLYLEPVSLGWELDRGAVRAAYGLVVPWKSIATPSAVGQSLTVGATYYVDADEETQISLNSVTEFQGRQRSSLTFGDNTTLEVAAGQAFAMDDFVRVHIGYAAYGQWQFTSDTGPYYTAEMSRRRTRVFGFGPEAGVIFPKQRASFVVRVESEFAARSHAEGAMVILGVAKSF